MYLFDTNVISELRRPASADPNVLRWASGVEEDRIRLSVVTIQEIDLGVQRLARRDTRQAAMLAEWFERDVLDRHRDRILPIDIRIARRMASLHVPVSRPAMDALLAATALVHGLTLATRNERDFVGTGVDLINPWRATAVS